MELSTIGYEGMSLSTFLSTLRQYHIATLVDVRQNPISRKPGFSKTALSNALQLNGFEYLHLYELGAPRNIRNDYKSDNDWNRYTVGYLQHLAEQDEPIARLLKLAISKHCCLLCFESDPQTCHRYFVANELVRQGRGQLSIQHIRIENQVAQQALHLA